MTPGGKLTYEKHYPYFFVNYEKGSKIFDGDLNYHRLDALAIHQFGTKLGYTNIKVFGGFLPEQHQYGKTLKLLDKQEILAVTGRQK